MKGHRDRFVDQKRTTPVLFEDEIGWKFDVYLLLIRIKIKDGAFINNAP